MKFRAQQSMYWLGINKDIENHVMSCDLCQVNGKSQQKEPIIPFEVPNRPWQRVGYRPILPQQVLVYYCS